MTERKTRPLDDLKIIVQGLERIERKLNLVLENQKLTEDQKVDIHETNFPYSGSIT